MSITNSGVMGFATTTTQTAYRFRNDDGNETAATWMDNINTPTILPISRNIRIRIAMQATNGTFTMIPVLYYSRNGSTFFNVAGANACHLHSSTFIANNGATTQQISSGGSGFKAGKIISTGAVDNVALLSENYTEFEICFQLGSGVWVEGDTLALLMKSGSNSLNVYTNYPTMLFTSYVPPSSIETDISVGRPYRTNEEPNALYKRHGIHHVLFRDVGA